MEGQIGLQNQSMVTFEGKRVEQGMKTQRNQGQVTLAPLNQNKSLTNGNFW